MNPVEAHIEGQARLRAAAEAAVVAAWRALPSYDEQNVPAFLARAVPAVAIAQRSSIALTAAFLARQSGEQLPAADVAAILAATRAGVPLEEVYRRPFVTVWTALQDGTRWEDAVAAGLARASGSAAFDVQAAMRGTLRDVGERTDRIVGYERVPDAGACSFCRLVAGQRYTTAQLMPLHNRCGCGVDVITRARRDEFFEGNRANDLDLSVEDARVAIEQHGELGPVLVDAQHQFTAL